MSELMHIITSLFSIDDIKFFINALIKGYYDKEVFVQ